MKKLLLKPLTLLIVAALAIFVIPSAAFADSTTVIAEPTQTAEITSTASVTDNRILDKNGNLISPTATSVAILTMFSDGTDAGIGSSGSTFGTHSFITVKNISSSAITVGGLSGIASQKTVSVGTWGNQDENKGLWYNLEALYVNNNSAYKNRVSKSMYLTQTQLNSINTYIKNSDSWSHLNNCSTFAVGLWNSVSSDTYSAGSPNTPKTCQTLLKMEVM
ncbi:hypothetical protein M3231_19575 [Neobacillus mesonae]|nr:hypothetical protein [Neobacillus mesonae]